MKIADGVQWRTLLTKVTSGTCRYWQRLAVRMAQVAWRIQDSNLEIEGLKVPSDCTVLVFVKDSVAAGNCETGSLAFAQTNGWGERKFVPAQWLVNKESRAKAAAKVALARYWASQRQMAA
jgi:hypothetical protein